MENTKAILLPQLAALGVTLLFLTVFSGIFYHTTYAFHCGGDQIGHPGGTEFPCDHDHDDTDDGDEAVFDDDTDDGDEAGGTLRNPLRFTTLTAFLEGVIDVLLIIAVPIVVFFIIYAGFLYVTAQGNEEKIRKATTAFTWAVVGGLLVLGARVLIEVIQGTVNAIT